VLKVRVTSFLILVGTIIAGCDQTKEVLGLKRERPDEFQVLDRRPLSVPPGYGLRPPLPGQKGVSEHTPREDAQALLLGKEQEEASIDPSHHDKSATEAEILQKAQTEKKDEKIREKLANEVESNKPSIGEKMAFWKKSKPKGDVIDSKTENKKYNGSELPGRSSQTDKEKGDNATEE